MREEKQRGFGIIPNFFEVYGPNPAPLGAKLKFSLAFRFATDPFSVARVAILAGVGQATNTSNYDLGGDLASAAISTFYYPESNHDAGLFFQNFAVNSAAHMAFRLLEEFVFRPSR